LASLEARCREYAGLLTDADSSPAALRLVRHVLHTELARQAPNIWREGMEDVETRRLRSRCNQISDLVKIIDCMVAASEGAPLPLKEVPKYNFKPGPAKP
jgi:hypothetical protein